MPIDCRISVSGQEIKSDISSVQLDQYVDDHHVLKLRLRRIGEASAEEDLEDPSKYTDFLGKPISLTIESDDVYDEPGPVSLEFIGLVTEISIDNSIDDINVVLLTAHSPTIAMDGARRNKLFHEQSASDIISAVLQNHSITVGGVESTSGTLAYCVQYRETDYEFVMRLAASSGLFAYYDGTEFKVGKAHSANTELTWRHILTAFTMGLGTGTEKFSSQVFDYSKKEVYGGETSGSLRTSLSGLPKASHDASKVVYPNDSFIPGLKSDSQATLDKSLETRRESSVGGMITCTGSSYHPLVSVGKCVKINGMGKLDGLLWVKSVRHVFKMGDYQNSFVCTPLDAAYPQRKHVRKPFSDLQSAVVTDTNDPDNLGRVKVKFHWNESGSSAAAPEKWLRVLTPHAGGEKGFFCIPEVDDEVLVGYVHGDPDRPVVMGSLYNGVDMPPVDHPAGWSGADNDLKLFRTKSGNEIYFHDGSGAETLSIVQKDNKNMITLTLDGPQIAIESEGDVNIKGANISLESTSGDITLKAGGAINEESTADLKLKAGANLTAEAAANLEAKGGAQATFKGPMATVQGDSILTVKGGLVKIN